MKRLPWQHHVGIMSQCLEAAQSPTLRCSAFHLQFQLELCCTSLLLPRFTANIGVGHVALGQNLVPHISDASIIYFIHLHTNSGLNTAKICDPPFQSLGFFLTHSYESQPTSRGWLHSKRIGASHVLRTCRWRSSWDLMQFHRS